MAVGVGVLTQLGSDTSYWLVLAGIVPIGAGMALATSPATTDIVAALPEHKQGVASAVNDAAREVGGTLGIAVLGSILNEQYRSGVADAAPAATPHAVVEGAQQSLGAALGIASALGDRGQQLADAARNAFISGMAEAFAASAGLLVLAALLFGFLIPKTEERTTEGNADPEQDEPPVETDEGRSARSPGQGCCPALARSAKRLPPTRSLVRLAINPDDPGWQSHRPRRLNRSWSPGSGVGGPGPEPNDRPRRGPGAVSRASCGHLGTSLKSTTTTVGPLDAQGALCAAGGSSGSPDTRVVTTRGGVATPETH